MRYTSGYGFTAEQLGCICTALYHRRDGGALVRLFSEFVDEQQLVLQGGGLWPDDVMMGYIYALFHSCQFERLFDVVTRGSFSPHYFKDLQELWYRARYKENERKRQKMLGAVEKYRLRRKYPPPASIWDGEETVYSFKENSRKFLKQFYKGNPYPTLEQKREISRVTELEIVQISNWFKNRRQREKCGSGSGGSHSKSAGQGALLPPSLLDAAHLSSFYLYAGGAPPPQPIMEGFSK